MMKIIICICICILPLSAFAGWNHTPGTIHRITTFAHTGTILVTLKEGHRLKVGTDVPSCANKDTFAINGALPENRRNQMLDMLLTASQNNWPIIISYDEVSNCVEYGGMANQYRSILRISLKGHNSSYLFD